MAADVAENLRALLLKDATIAQKCKTRIAQDTVPQPGEIDKDSAGRLAPFIYFARTGVRIERCLDDSGSQEPFGHYFAVECIAEDLNEAEALARAVFAYDGYSGTFGDTTVQAIFVEDQSSDYVPKAADLSRGEHVAAMQVEVCP